MQSFKYLIVSFLVACAAGEPDHQTTPELPDCTDVAPTDQPTSGSGVMGAGTVAPSGTSDGTSTSKPTQAQLDAAARATEAQGRLPMGPPYKPCRSTGAPSPAPPTNPPTNPAPAP